MPQTVLKNPLSLTEKREQLNLKPANLFQTSEKLSTITSASPQRKRRRRLPKLLTVQFEDDETTASHESRSILPNMTISDDRDDDDDEPNLNLDETHQDDIYVAFNDGADISRITTESSRAPGVDEQDVASSKKTSTGKDDEECCSHSSKDETHDVLHVALNDAPDISRITVESTHAMIIKNQDTSFTKLLTSKNDSQPHSSEEKQRLVEAAIQRRSLFCMGLSQPVPISNKEGQPERGLFGGFAGVVRAKLVSCIAPPVLSSPDTKR